VQVGLSFLIGGVIPALPVIFSLPFFQWWAYGLTAITAMVLGAIKARYTGQGVLRAGLEFLIIVTVGTLAGVGVGTLLHIG
jgi:VIT1/CCC1 family predicted Fe2+/Mn2+ transporter